MSLKSKPSAELVRRWEGNPLISIEDLDFQCAHIRSPGVAVHENELILLVTIENLSGFQSIHIARDVRKNQFVVNRKPFLMPSTNAPYNRHESHGIMDARVTFLDNAYYITYLAHGDDGFRVALARTTDFQKVDRLGIITEPDDKAGALFPRKIGERYALLHRPNEGNSIWVSFSNDLEYWGSSSLVLTPRGGFWDSTRIGCGPPPIEIEQGWLLIYYGVKKTSAGPLYRIGAAILDRDDPTRIVVRGNIPLLAPRETYERIGDIPNMVYTVGAHVYDEGNIDIFYSSADGAICMAQTTIDRIVTECVESKEAF